MGADLVLAIMELPEPEVAATHFTPELKEFWKTTLASHINSLSDKSILSEYAEAYYDTPEPPEDTPSRSEDRVVAQLCREHYIKLIEDYTENDYRDCYTIRLGNRWHLISGGLTSGDDPSSSFGDVSALGSIYPYPYIPPES